MAPVPLAFDQSVSRIELTPLSFLRRSAAVFPDNVAVVHGNRGTSYDYRTLAERVDRLASALQTAGLRRHDRVAFLCPNIPPMVEAHFGVPAAGGVLVPINTRLSSEEIGYILRHSGARFLFVDATLQDLTAPLDLSGIAVIRIDDIGIVGDPYEDFLAAGSPEPVPATLTDEEEAISINYTSGTTGHPKGVLATHRGAYLLALGQIIETGLTAESIFLWTQPMFHTNGWGFPWAVAALGGAQVCLRRLEPGLVWELIDAYGITHYIGAPSPITPLRTDSPTPSRSPWRGRLPPPPCSPGSAS
jgi:fatty-acyl-CoA synthase